MWQFAMTQSDSACWILWTLLYMRMLDSCVMWPNDPFWTGLSRFSLVCPGVPKHVTRTYKYLVFSEWQVNLVDRNNFLRGYRSTLFFETRKSIKWFINVLIIPKKIENTIRRREKSVIQKKIRKQVLSWPKYGHVTHACVHIK